VGLSASGRGGRTPYRGTMTRLSKSLGAALALCSLFVLITGAGSANATRGLVTGFSDGLYQSSDPAERALWLDRTVQSGAGLIRVNVGWRAIAPTRPADPANPGSAAYKFGSLDATVSDARARGLAVMVTVEGAPSWAEGPGRPASADPGTWEPDPTALAAFMQAIALRYSGGFDPDGAGGAPALPAVQALQVWNEANLPEYLNPQYQGSDPFSPDYYRQMLNASYAAVKAVDPAMLIVTAGTAPYGGSTAKGPRVRPVEFDRDLLCVEPVKARRKGKHRKKAVKLVRNPGCAAPANFDVLAHHPINTSGPPTQHAFNADDASSADLPKITRVLRAAEQAGTVSPGRHPIWATEMWWDSNPPDAAGSPLGRQARWIEQSLYLLWRDGAGAVINLRIRDVAVNSQVLDGTGSGIYFANGQPKPSAVAFRFPFVTDRLNRSALRAWGKAPATGKLVIQRRARGRWATVRKLRVRQGAVFAVKLRLGGKQRLRARVAGNTSLVWAQR
jgi:hypothetical protein